MNAIPAYDEFFRAAEYAMWKRELEATRIENGIEKPDWHKRRIAAMKICELSGIVDVIRAISLDGELRPPPEWPECDIVPVGGGPGWLGCEVRTNHPQRGRLSVSARIAMPKTKVTQADVSAALERGRWELCRLLEH